jgi:hypothetical protein
MPPFWQTRSSRPPESRGAPSTTASATSAIFLAVCSRVWSAVLADEIHSAIDRVRLHREVRFEAHRPAGSA